MRKKTKKISKHPHLQVSEIRQAILQYLKQKGSTTLQYVAKERGVTFEAVRQQMAILEREGWVRSQIDRQAKPKVGRPTRSYFLTPAGDHLFPKHYDLLASEVIGALVEELGPLALKKILSSLTEARVKQWAPLLEGKNLKQKLEALKGIYFEDDPYTQVTQAPDGIRLIEKNCPFLNVALKHPALCSLTVSLLTRLLGFQVLREERFQHGDARCVFRILTERPVDPKSFKFEFEENARKASRL